jgi:hypothetical protein
MAIQAKRASLEENFRANDFLISGHLNFKITSSQVSLGKREKRDAQAIQGKRARSSTAPRPM